MMRPKRAENETVLAPGQKILLEQSFLLIDHLIDEAEDGQHAANCDQRSSQRIQHVRGQGELCDAIARLADLAAHPAVEMGALFLRVRQVERGRLPGLEKDARAQQGGGGDEGLVLLWQVCHACVSFVFFIDFNAHAKGEVPQKASGCGPPLGAGEVKGRSFGRVLRLRSG